MVRCRCCVAHAFVLTPAVVVIVAAMTIFSMVLSIGTGSSTNGLFFCIAIMYVFSDGPSFGAGTDAGDDKRCFELVGRT